MLFRAVLAYAWQALHMGRGCLRAGALDLEAWAGDMQAAWHMHGLCVACAWTCAWHARAGPASPSTSVTTWPVTRDKKSANVITNVEKSIRLSTGAT